MILRLKLLSLMFLVLSTSGMAYSKPGDLPQDEFERRREIFISELRELNACAIIHSAPEQMRNHDVEYPYRQDSDFFYLTGWSPKHAILVLTPKSGSHDTIEAIFFAPERDIKREVWTGPEKIFTDAMLLPGIDLAFSYDDFFDHLGKLVKGYERLVVSYGNDSQFEEACIRSLAKSYERPPITQEATSLLKAHRMIKSDWEIQALEHAIKITGESLEAAFKKIPTLNFEYEVQAEIEYGFKKRGAQRLGFPSIVGAGKNSCYLHYTGSQGALTPGDIILMDVGAEWDYYSADISRSVPTSGKFSAEQALIYQLVLDAQSAAIATVKPGASFRKPHHTAVQVLTEGLVKLGLLSGEPEELIKEKKYRKFFMHGTSHWLGLDVHDAGGRYDASGTPYILKAGMVLTVEPGIYISQADDVDPKWWNIGIRIEDDVLVTEKGHRVLSASIPKTIAQIEAVMQP